MDKDDVAGYLETMVDAQSGVACATVSDGHVLLFRTGALRGLLAKAEASEKGSVVVFIKRSMPQSSS